MGQPPWMVTPLVGLCLLFGGLRPLLYVLPPVGVACDMACGRALSYLYATSMGVTLYTG